MVQIKDAVFSYVRVVFTLSWEVQNKVAGKSAMLLF